VKHPWNFIEILIIPTYSCKIFVIVSLHEYIMQEYYGKKCKPVVFCWCFRAPRVALEVTCPGGLAIYTSYSTERLLVTIISFV
jgi:hypothetical protein